MFSPCTCTIDKYKNEDGKKNYFSHLKLRRKGEAN